jgi:hypothetical protein
VSSTEVTVGSLRLSLDVLVPVLPEDSETQVVMSMTQLPSGLVMAEGFRANSDGANGTEHMVWMSTDGARTFEQAGPGLDELDVVEYVAGFAEVNGSLYVFGGDLAASGAARVWSSGDGGASWVVETFPTTGVLWGGTVGGWPTMAVYGPQENGLGTSILQLRDGQWLPSLVPGLDPDSEVAAIVELSTGVALAVGDQCTTDPACGAGTEPADSSPARPDSALDPLVWISRDGGQSWTDESGPYGGAPNAQFATAATVIDGQALIGITGSTLQGEAFFLGMNSTTDGPSWSGYSTQPPWDGGATPVRIESIAALERGLVALVVATTAQEGIEYAWIYDGDTGQHSFLDMRETTGLRVTAGVATIDGVSFAYGTGECGVKLCPMLIAFRPLAG